MANEQSPPPKKKRKAKFQKADQSLEFEYLGKLREKVRVRNPLLSDRLYYLLIWYGWKAEYNKLRYNLYRTLTSVLLGLISILSVCAVFWTEKIISIATVSVCVIITLMNQRTDQYRYYENWVRYRSVAEKLKREAHLFLNSCEPYADGKPEENERRFALAMEDLVSEESANWQSLYEDSFQKYQRMREQTAQMSQFNNASHISNASGADLQQ